MQGQVPLAGAYGRGRLMIGQLGSGTYVQSQTLSDSSTLYGRMLTFTNDASKFILGDLSTTLELYARA